MSEVEEYRAELAKRSPNFCFLLDEDLQLASLGASAEAQVFTEPSLTVVRARQFAEEIVKWGCANADVQYPDNLTRGIKELSKKGVLHQQIADVLYKLRDVGNRGAHEYYAERHEAFNAVRQCFVLGSWRMRTATGDRTPRAFVPTQPPSDEPEPTTAQEREALDELNAEVEEYRRQVYALNEELLGAQSSRDAAEQARHRTEQQLQQANAAQQYWYTQAEELQEQINQLLAEQDSEPSRQPTASERDAFIQRARRQGEPPLTEAQVRERLDKLLRSAGWKLQDKNEENLYAGQGVAVKEVHTRGGYADYLLYIDRKLVGVIEAKREGEDLAKAQRQASQYATGLTNEQQISAWRPNLPFQYVTDGNETRFRNELDPKPRSRRIFAVHQPGTLAEWMRAAEDDPEHPTLYARLQQLPRFSLEEYGLRNAQHRAITGLERSWARNEPRALIQMATGAGKTFAAANFGYRYLKHARGRRILFLVDRNGLGKQAEGEFENFTTPDTGDKFDELYNVDRMSGSTVLRSSHVVISTIQRLWLTLTGQNVPDTPDYVDDEGLDEPNGPVEVGYNPSIPPEMFDLIVVDECHRSIYGTWRAVLQYFDAYLVGLTATPIRETFGFFEQNLVSEYTYEESVGDGVNVPFEVYRIDTEIGEQGATIDAGTVVPVRDTKTRRERLEDLDDDLIYTGNQEGRRTISKGRLRAVIAEFRDKLFTHIFPPLGEDGPARQQVPKTLIFACTDEHAEEIVAEVRKTLGEGDAFCQKITSKAPKANNRLQEFRNSAEMRIAVTVDMISTGTDVRPLECVFFLREPKTWSLFEQMKGRGARTVDSAELKRATPDADTKTHFVIVDAVGVTDEKRSETRPMEQPAAKQVSLEKLLKKAASQTTTPDDVCTLGSRLAKLGQQVGSDDKEELSEIADQPFQNIVKGLTAAGNLDRRAEVHRQAVEEHGGDEDAGEEAVQQFVEDAVRPLAANPQLRERILQVRRAHDTVIDEINEDRITQSYGTTAEERAQHVVESFRDYMTSNQDEIAALEIAFRERRHRHEVYGKLRDLARQLEKPPHRWTPERLYNAYATLGKTNGSSADSGVPDLIGILRCELGLDEQVRPYRELVEERYQAWFTRQSQAEQSFTTEQRWWLDQVVETIAKNVTFQVEDLHDVPFSKQGGTQGFVHAFGQERAKALIDELNEELSA